MKINFTHNNFFIEIFDDSAFSGNTDSPTCYDKIYEPPEDKDYQSGSQHAIFVYAGKKQIANAILLSAAGATVVTNDVALIDNDNLVIRCGNTLYSLTLPELELNWMVQADPVTCFHIYKYRESYITHGEISICRIGRNGIIIWQFGGRDIFLRLEGDDEFRMNDDSITVKDFFGTIYTIDYNGNNISIIDPVRIKKKWWQCW